MSDFHSFFNKKTPAQPPSADCRKPFSCRSIPWKKILLGTAAAAAALILLLLLLLWYLIATAPDIDSVSVSPTESATYICDQEGTYLRKLTLASSNRDIVPLSEIPVSLRDAVVAIEDERFYEHSGIDPRGILRAVWTGITSGSFSEGASTITQQLIKNHVFTDWTQENSFADRFRRKVQEQYLALQLEKRMDKDEILENYLNTINLGAGCYGVQAASRRYFGRDVSELTLSECAVLAAIPQNPSGYDPIRHPDANRRRQLVVLNYMEAQGYITRDAHRDAETDPVYDRIQKQNDDSLTETVYSYYEDALIDQVLDVLTEELGLSQDQAYRAVYSGGLRIFSAQDPDLQQICDEEFANPANFPAGTEFGIDYALSVAGASGPVTHYGSEALRSFVRERFDPEFDLLCTSAATAQQYADAFREAILESGSDTEDSSTSDSESDAENFSHSDPGSDTEDSSTSDPGSDTEDSSTSDSESGSRSILAERLTLSPQPQASLVLMDPDTGLVRALVGGRGEKSASLTLNRASDTTRQPGSTFKILAAYAPALDTAGQTLATLYDNEPYFYEDGTPVSNWDLSDYTGPETIRDAIVRSVNVIAVRCITQITPQLGFQYAERFGISTLHERYEANGQSSSDLVQPLALGGITQGVTNLELCSAYAAIANQGIYRSPKFFTKILDRSGAVVFDSFAAESSDPEASRILKESTAFLLTDAMRGVVSDPSGTAYGSIFAAGQPVSGKTGTTSAYKDIWFTGSTPYYTCSVWGGYDNNKSLPDGPLGHTFQKSLWSAVMNRVHADLPPAEFEQPSSVTSVLLCQDSHLPAVPDGCPHTYTEFFAKGTEPAGECPLHEPIPETEPIFIYPDILEQLLPDTGTNTERETISEAETEQNENESAVPGQSESGSIPPDQTESGNSNRPPDPWPEQTESGSIPPDQTESGSSDRPSDTWPEQTESGSIPPGQMESGSSDWPSDTWPDSKTTSEPDALQELIDRLYGSS